MHEILEANTYRSRIYIRLATFPKRNWYIPYRTGSRGYTFDLYGSIVWRQVCYRDCGIISFWSVLLTPDCSYLILKVTKLHYLGLISRILYCRTNGSNGINTCQERELRDSRVGKVPQFLLVLCLPFSFLTQFLGITFDRLLRPSRRSVPHKSGEKRESLSIARNCNLFVVNRMLQVHKTKPQSMHLLYKLTI